MDVKNVVDKIKTLLVEIPNLKLNETSTAEELIANLGRIAINESGIDIDISANLGGGAVAKAYDVVVDLIGTGGKTVAYMWSFAAGMWLASLPEVDEKPGHYLSCGYNDYLYRTYELQLINGVATARFQPALKVIGTYLAYFNFLALVGETADDWARFRVPEQPAGGCGIPGIP
jgi:hypothetical protein